MPVQQPYVSNVPLTVAANLRFRNSAGILVETLLPIGMTGNIVTDTPETGYISLIGARCSDLIATYQQVTQVLASYNTRITALEQSVNAIQTSGVTFQLYVNGGCLLGNTTVTVPAAVTALIASECDYSTILGTPTELANTVAAQCTNLATLPAYSQDSAMSGLAGWFTTPTTIAQVQSNDLKAYCDMRSAMDTVMAAITPTCSQVIVDYQVVTGSSLTFNLYFGGYSFIPSGFTDNGSTVTIQDSAGHSYPATFNIVSYSNSNSPLSLMTSGTTLSSTSAYYTVSVTSKVQNTTLGLSCEKVVIKTVTNTGSSTGTGYDIGNYTALTSGVTSVTFLSSLSYTPKMISITPKNSFTAGLIADQNYSLWVGNIAGGGTVNFLAAPSGTLNFDYITYRP